MRTDTKIGDAPSGYPLLGTEWTSNYRSEIRKITGAVRTEDGTILYKFEGGFFMTEKVLRGLYSRVVEHATID